MGFSDLFGTFTHKNTELATLADFGNEAAINTAREQSGGSTMGINEHAFNRQAQYLQNAKERLDALANAPIPDLPATHPMTFETTHIEPDLITVDEIPLNKDTKALCQMWQVFAYELLKSNSAGIGGGAHSFDVARANQNLGAIEQFVGALNAATDVDMPETAHPDATVTVSATNKRKR
jgi:hypothetical protein